MKPITDLIPILEDFHKIIITTHASPDADALGSSLGLFHFLKARGHEVQVITPTDYPNFISWLPGNDQVLEFNSADDDLILEMIQSCALIFCLDFSGLKRIKGLADAVASSPALKVMIDHHLDPEDFDDYRLWDTSAAATAELIYDFILSVDGKKA
ncbi:MAG: bifunctional oligoribonuclease/PAP phosphatase NrnA, partial [Flammeovirgaceae bacterium]|nr:bifunctional oligoribonuclease/PAP phosphatase NrnA [Flammeovirgaceae bacterium]